MKSYMFGILLYLVVLVDYTFIQSVYHIVPQEWLWIALIFYLLGTLTGLRPGTNYRHASSFAVFAMGLALMLVFRALTVREWVELANYNLGQFMIRIAALIAFDVFFVALVAVIYWGCDRWERARAARDNEAPPREG
jgi:cbb3-type cytochrome oxidase subunit 3